MCCIDVGKRYLAISLSFCHSVEKKKHVSTEGMTRCHLCHSQLEAPSRRNHRALIVMKKECTVACLLSTQADCTN